MTSFQAGNWVINASGVIAVYKNFANTIAPISATAYTVQGTICYYTD